MVVDTPNLNELKEEITRDTAKALSKAAADAALAVREELPKKFTLRNGYVKRGIRYRKAYPDRPFAEVYSRDAFMTKQEDGGAFSKGSHRFAIPKGVRSSEKSLVPRAKKPRYILNNKDRIFKSSKNDPRNPNPGTEGIYMRIRNNKRLKLLYLLTGKKSYKPHWEFEETVEKEAMKGFREYMEWGV
ncbi:hypothetical protein [Pseudobacteriovorax antillogorgiicola]|uniref:Uncharacterized protein n=1 Tax=Pseudobacteriovorax antillogorgiicola TaxID=1513793 RepID=A0A1Y6CUM2_9BACT|nr:hypothetical protein [Pseudobacteriovorax antillogorgiicola]TCS44239.1 hypothetical protein EDD56_13439 [Pseudobacteriovorax antillogorgiicola]SMF80676.1 hypothetical protein SAMN06296036_13540 [Pseudobacteriovorax antillogorgiicola]